GLLERPFAAPNPSTHAYLERHAARLLEALDPERWSDRVRRTLAENLRRGTVQQAQVARRLAVSERTLQRRLGEEGLSFAGILDAVRRDLCLGYIAEPSLAVYEIAFLLGYSEPSALHRAFRRWTGESPQAYRAKRGG